VELTFLGTQSPTQGRVFWNTLIALFEKDNPDIKVKLVLPPSEDRDPYGQQLLAAGNFPDVQFMLRAQLFKDSLMAWDLNDPDVKQLNDPSANMIDGKLYQLGIYQDPWNMIFYNKDQFAKAGITATPKTWAEFETALAKLKAAGFLPMLTAGEWVTGFQFGMMSETFVNYAHDGIPCLEDQRRAGKIHFQDEDFKIAAARWGAWAKNGYFPDGAIGLKFTDLWPMFVAGKGAMFELNSYPAALAKTTPAPFEIGVFPVPTTDGAIAIETQAGSLGYTVSNMTKYPEQAVRLAKWFAFNPVPLAAVLSAQGQYPNVKLTSGATIDVGLTPLQEQVLAIANSAEWIANVGGNCGGPPKGFPMEFGPLAQSLILGGDGADELKALDDGWDKAQANEASPNP
jgi:ABC-type glycerol-3-phosphate transport system substrate-binding protein